MLFTALFVLTSDATSAKKPALTVSRGGGRSPFYVLLVPALAFSHHTAVIFIYTHLDYKLLDVRVYRLVSFAAPEHNFMPDT